MTSLNDFTCLGNADRNPQIHTTGDGRLVCNFKVAIDRWLPPSKVSSGRKLTDWIPVTCWGQLAEKATNIRKGDKVLVKGAIKTRPYQKEGIVLTTFEVTAESIEIILPENDY